MSLANKFLVLIFDICAFTLLWLPPIIIFAPLQLLSRLWVRFNHGWKHLDSHAAGIFLNNQEVRMTSFMVSILDGQYTDKHLECLRSRYRKFLELPPSHLMKCVPVVVFGYPYWKPIGCEVDRHVRVMDVEPDRTYTENEVMGMVSGTLNQPFELGRPMWDTLFVPKVTLDGATAPRFAVIFRFHHTMGDAVNPLGIACKHFMDNVAEYSPIPPSPPMPWWRKMLVDAFAVLTMTSAMLPMGIRCMQMASKLPRQIGDSHMVVSSPIPVDLIRFIKSKCGTKFSEVIISSSGAALHRHFSPYQDWLHDIPTGIPFAVPTPPDQLENNILVLNMPTANRKLDPIVRLRETSKAVSKGRRSLQMLQYVSAVKVLGLFQHWLLRFVYSQFGVPAVISYVPGCRETLSIGGAPMCMMAAVSPLMKPIGISVCAITYGNMLRVVVNADRGTVDGVTHVEKIAQEFVESTFEIGRILGYNNNGYTHLNGHSNGKAH